MQQMLEDIIAQNIVYTFLMSLNLFIKLCTFLIFAIFSTSYLYIYYVSLFIY